MVDFAATGYGRKFFDADLPRVVRALERIATALERLADDADKQRSGQAEPAKGNER